MKGIKIHFNGKEYCSASKFASDININYHTLMTCSYKNDISIEEAVTMILNNPRRYFVAPDGKKYKSESEYCRIIGASPSRVAKRRARGIVEPKLLYKKDNPESRFTIVDPWGKKWPSKKVMCENYPVKHFRTYAARINSGWDEKEALMVPSRSVVYKDLSGKEWTLAEICRESEANLNHTTVKDLLEKGLSIEEILSYKPMPSCRYITDPNGVKYRNEHEMCETWGQDYEHFRWLRKKGNSLLDSLTIKAQDRSVVDFTGKRWPSQNKMLKHYNVNYKTYMSGIEKGLSQKEILLKPKQVKLQDRIGEVSVAANGLKGTIISISEQPHKVNIEFEDGVVIKDIQYDNFKKGVFQHPTLKTRGEGSFCGYNTRRVGTDLNGNVWYEAEKGEIKDILTPQMMMEHEKKCRQNL